jgi:hypothetical protein
MTGVRIPITKRPRRLQTPLRQCTRTATIQWRSQALQCIDATKVEMNIGVVGMKSPADHWNIGGCRRTRTFDPLIKSVFSAEIACDRMILREAG